MINFRHPALIISHCLIPSLCIAPLLVAFELTHWDLQLAHLFYDETHATFIWEGIPWIELWLHDRARDLTQIYSLTALAAFLISFIWPRLAPYRRDFLFIALGVGLATGTISLLKRTTHIHCPVQLTEFGGHYAYVKLFGGRVGEHIGKCWPGGHAGAGFAFMSLYFVGRRHVNRYAMLVLSIGVLLGFFYGSVRILQGQHFMSHTLWSGIIIWLVLYLVATWLLKPSTSVFKAAPSPDPVLLTNQAAPELRN